MSDEKERKDVYASRVLGIASIVAVSALAWTVSRKSKKSMALMNNSIFSTKHPKAAAYLFAGQAFGTATALVACTTFAVGMGISMLTGIRNLQDFNTVMSSWAKSTFPDLHVSGKYDQLEDDSHLEFVREWINALDEEPKESEISKKISVKLKQSLGLD